MIKFDFKTYTNKFINQQEYNNLINKKGEILKKINTANMNGWLNIPDIDTINDIKKTADFIKNNFDCLIVIGIGGSYLGSYSFDKIFRKYFKDDKYEIIYAGTALSSKYIENLLEYLKNKNYCINVISKSGETLETKITYKILKDQLKRKYDEEEIKKTLNK